MFIYLYPNGRVTADSLAALLRTLNAYFQGKPLNGTILYCSTNTKTKRLTP